MKMMLVQGEIETLIKQVYQMNNLRIMQSSLDFKKDPISGSISVEFNVEKIDLKNRTFSSCCGTINP